MFKITPIQNAEHQKEVAKICHTYYKEDSFGYEMIEAENGALLGMSQFEIENGKAKLFDLRQAPDIDDFEAMFILGRQTLNFMDLCGVHECFADKDAGDERLLKCVGFKPNENGDYHCSMVGMFDGHCDGKTKKI